jgi:hypothetical protein
MRVLIILLLCVINYFSNAQNWISIPKNQSFKRIPRDFKINPYKNQLWFIWDEEVNMIEENGLKHKFTSNELGVLWLGDDLSFAFTPNNIYYSMYIYGLYSFNNFISQNISQDSDIYKLESSLDTIYLLHSNNPFNKYINSQFITTYIEIYGIKTKNEFQYIDVGVIGKINGPNQNDIVYLFNDPEYLQSEHNYFCFSRYTDTFYLASKQGISFAYNYDFLDTITPNNTVNMPSSNVLEMEFDQLDRLWAVFGDENDQAFSLAMLENETWVNYYDANNSPIQFLHPTGQNGFYGLEIDTLGNVWVCDYANLHTLLSPTTPAWVGLHENKKNNFEIYPNPTENKVNIKFIDHSIKKILLTDLKGNILQEIESSEKEVQLSLEKVSSGIYFVAIKEENQISYQKISKK